MKIKKHFRNLLSSSSFALALASALPGKAQYCGATVAADPNELIVNGDFEQYYATNTTTIAKNDISTYGSSSCSPDNVKNWYTYALSDGNQLAGPGTEHYPRGNSSFYSTEANFYNVPVTLQRFIPKVSPNITGSAPNTSFAGFGCGQGFGCIVPNQIDGLATELKTPVLAGQTYQLTAWVYLYTGQHSDIPIFFYFHNNYLITDTQFKSTLDNGSPYFTANLHDSNDPDFYSKYPYDFGWERISILVTIPAGTNFATSYSHMGITGGSGYFFIDDVSLKGSCVGSATVLGNPGTVTYIDASNAPVNFSGNYLIDGPLVLQNGTFNFAPNTQFNINPAAGVDPVTMGLYDYDEYHHDQNQGTGIRLNYFPTLIKASNATLNLAGATLTNTCNDNRKWGGIYLTDFSFINMTAGNGTIRNQINKACIGIASAQTDIFGFEANNDNFYNLQATDFTDNTTGFSDHGRDMASLTGEGIQNCTFTNCNKGLSFEPVSGLTPRPNGGEGGWYQLAVFAYNTFTDCYYGIAGDANEIIINDNTFTGDFDYGIWLGRINQNANNFIRYNNINLLNTQISLKYRYGILVPDGATVNNNTITGIGIQQFTVTNGNFGIIGFDPQQTQIFRNTISNINTGIGISGSYSTLLIKDNTLIDNIVGIHLGAIQFGSALPTVKCNGISAPNLSLIYNKRIGIQIAPNSTLTQLGESGQQPGTVHRPNGNKFDASINFPVFNDSSQPIDYWVYALPSTEGMPNRIDGSGGGSRPVSSLSPVNACGNIAPGVSSPGVNARIGGNGVADIKEMLDSLGLNRGSFKHSKYLQREIIAWHEKESKVTELVQYMPKLKNKNREAYNTFGLYLMQYYRNQKQESNAQFLKNLLLNANPGDAEIENRARYFDLVGRWPGSLPTANRLTPTDSVDLAKIIASGTSLSKSACFLLSLYYPANTCNAANDSSPRYGNAKATNAASGIQQIYPNPANTEATLSYILPTGCISAKLIVIDLVLGREIKTINLAAAEGSRETQLNLRNFKSGLYNCALFIDDKPAGNRKLSVIK